MVSVIYATHLRVIDEIRLRVVQRIKDNELNAIVKLQAAVICLCVFVYVLVSVCLTISVWGSVA